MNKQTNETTDQRDNLNSLVRCGDCKFWGEDDEQDWLNVSEAKFCTHRMVSNVYADLAYAGDEVCVFPEGGCTGKLCTMPNFGCVHFSPND